MDRAVIELVVLQVGAAELIAVGKEVELLLRAHHRRVGGICSLLIIDGTTVVVGHVVVFGLVRLLGEDGVSGWIVEDDDVVEFNMPESLHTAVVPLRPGNIALHVDDGHRMLCERHGERGFGNAGAVAQF